MGTIPNKASSTPPILKLVLTIVILANNKRFVAKNNLVLDANRKVKVKISYLGYDLTKWFLFDTGKIEGPTSEQTLYCYRLRKFLADDQIIAALGGEEKAETTLLEMFSLMKKQKNGEKGVLLTNGRANIFYIRDQNGVLRVVRVHWHGGGWDIYADSVESPGKWFDGYQVFSRNLIK